MIYDIHTKYAAQQTLQQLTGIQTELWIENLYKERDYPLQDDFVATMIQEYGTEKLPESYEDMQFVFFHITTSANQCSSILKYGLLDLQESYRCKESELRTFLNTHGVYIDLDDNFLSYNGHRFDIRYGVCPRNHSSIEYKCWSVGRKFYYDYTVCGFLSAWEASPYGGQVHRRPEILWDIDNLLGTQLSKEWEQSHIAYKIVARVNGNDICYPYDDDSSDEEKLMAYLVMAYNEAFNGNSENILLMKNNIQIPSKDILAIELLDMWSL